MLKDIVNLHKKPFFLIVLGTALVTLFLGIVGSEFFNRRSSLELHVKYVLIAELLNLAIIFIMVLYKNRKKAQ